MRKYNLVGPRETKRPLLPQKTFPSAAVPELCAARLPMETQE